VAALRPAPISIRHLPRPKPNVALVAAGAEATRLEAALAEADRQATDRESDQATVVIHPDPRTAVAVAARLPSW
jgi:hypothetical protein